MHLPMTRFVEKCHAIVVPVGPLRFHATHDANHAIDKRRDSVLTQFRLTAWAGFDSHFVARLKDFHYSRCRTLHLGHSFGLGTLVIHR